MPTLLQIHEKRIPAHPTVGSTSITSPSFDFQQRLLVCLVVVVAAILCAFGAARLLEHATKGRRVADVEEEIRARARLPPGEVEGTDSKGYPNVVITNPKSRRRSSIFCSYSPSSSFRRPLSLCAKPSPPLAIASTTPNPIVQHDSLTVSPSFVHTSPSLHHITAQRLYASRHPHRNKRAPPRAPSVAESRTRSPLRNLLYACDVMEMDVTESEEARAMRDVEILGAANMKKAKEVKSRQSRLTALRKLGKGFPTIPLLPHNRSSESTKKAHKNSNTHCASPLSVSSISSTRKFKSYGAAAHNAERNAVLGFAAGIGKENLATAMTL
ncbi:hypothetical protein HMN09_00354000 [Mycena chlorophos]|uniref:Uncharacterized protein n=1 Tax=Mycena chlorophos TaxID=658473 RepID=A0A8H6TGU3_MYCCL|nr:hypothetical protein HMN09_00354000 [Mycena chlorophos]